MKRACIVLLIASCADPAALEVRVTIRDQDLEKVELEVAKGDAMKRSPFVSCTAPFDGPLEGTCPFEDGEGRWTDPDRLSLLVYGEPDTPIAIAVDGFRSGRSVTATQAFTALPPTEGERRAIDIALLSRTSERSRCDVEVPSGGLPVPAPPDSNALGVFDLFGTAIAREIVVSANGNLAYGALVRGDETCEVQLFAYAGTDQCSGQVPFRWCHVRSGAMAVGPRAADAARPMVGALCESPAQLVAAFTTPRCALVRANRIPAGFEVADISDPVVVDADDDGDLEVVYTAVDRRGLGAGMPAPMSLLIFHPDRGSDSAVQVVPLTNTLGYEAMSPLAFRTRDGTVLIVAAATPAFGVFVRGSYFEAPGPAAAVLMRAPAMVAGVEEPGIVRVTQDEVQFVDVHVAGRGAWASTVRFAYDLSGLDTPLTADRDVRVAVGRLASDGAPFAVIVDDGMAHRFELASGGAAVSRPLWGDGVASGAQYALLASLDGAPGFEIFSHSKYGPQLAAATTDGFALEGWPIDLLSQTGRRHVVITDLDGPVDGLAESIALRDIELVTLSDDRLSVISLGPGSYDPRATPWPSANRDPLGSGTYVSDVDPTQIDGTAVFR